jgi:hypothetical protein
VITSPCPARLHDCRCVGGHNGESALAAMHLCAVPGCGAMWTTTGNVVRLPYHAGLPRRFGRPNLKVA